MEKLNHIKDAVSLFVFVINNDENRSVYYYVCFRIVSIFEMLKFCRYKRSCSIQLCINFVKLIVFGVLDFCFLLGFFLNQEFENEFEFENICC